MDDAEPAPWEGFVVKMIYGRKIRCDKSEFLEQLGSVWHVVPDNLNDKHKKSSQLEIWKELSKGDALEYPELCQFVQLMIKTSFNTSDLERAYSTLEVITTKPRNQLKIDNLEKLFVLANLQILVKSPLQYENKVAYIEENSTIWIAISILISF